MRDLLAILGSFLAAIAAAAVIWLWWRSPIPTFRVFTPLLHGMLLGVALHSIWHARGHVPVERRETKRITVAVLAAIASVVALMYGQYVADAYAHRDHARRALGAMPALALVTPPPPTGLSPVLTQYDYDVLSPATGKSGMAGYLHLRDRRAAWRGWLRLGEALIVIATATFIAGHSQKVGARAPMSPQD